MKKIALILITALVQATAVYAQDLKQRIVNGSLEKAMQLIADATRHPYTYDPGLFRKTFPVNIDLARFDLFKEADFKNALDVLFQGQPVRYFMDDRILHFAPATLRGKIIDENDAPIAGVSIVRSGKAKNAIRTDENGVFELSEAALDTWIDIMAEGYEAQRFPLNGCVYLNISLKKKVTVFDEVNVEINTGFATKNKERQTGIANTIVEPQKFGRAAAGIGFGLDNQAPGVVVFNKNIGLTAGFPPTVIRGISTLLADQQPLIVVDRFSYNGDLNQLNPNDIESITILKDAAATSIWGARAGNGVIVITTRQGKYGRRPQLSFSSQLTVWDKYDAHYRPALPAASVLELEDSVFKQGHYDLALFSGLGFVSPGVELLHQRRLGLIDDTQLAAAQAALASHDVRDDFDRYYYRPTTAQQYHLSLQGGDGQNRYYVSAGYDQLNHGLTQGKQNRYTVTANYSYKPWKVFEINLNTSLNLTRSRNDQPFPRIGYSYASLVDTNGMPATVNRDRPQAWKDQQQLLDWNYRPLMDGKLNNDSLYRLQTRIAMNMVYTITEGLRVQFIMQYLDERTNHTTRYPMTSYTYRHLYNSYAYNTVNGFDSYVPQGPIEQRQLTDYRAANFRWQVDYNHTWQDKWELTTLMGVEIARAWADTNSGFHYNKEVNFNTSYPLYQSFGPPAPLPGKPYSKSTFDFYRSGYFNSALALSSRYIVSVSGRIDQSNFFGANTNAQTQPLWSTGLKWVFTKEDFINLAWLKEANLHSSFGFSGNVDKSVSALLTVNAPVINPNGDPVNTIRNASNPNLRWETIRMANFGFDFQLRKKELSGSIDYYHRYGNNLLSNEVTRTTSGATIYRNNAAALAGSGIDLQLNAHLSWKKWQWNSTFLFAYTTNKVIRIDTAKQKVIDYLDPGTHSLFIGRPADGLYALHTATLNPANGNPRVDMNGKPSDDYNAILESPRSNLRYIGHSTPPITAALSQNIGYKGFLFSFTLAGYFGYYYRRPSIDYSGFIAGTNLGHPDFDNRWRKPGDEAHTSIPSFPAINDPYRDFVYSHSDGLVEKADNIRLREVRLSWTLDKKTLERKILSGATIFLYGANLGILWKASRYDLDPDTPFVMPMPKSVSVGIRFDLEP